MGKLRYGIIAALFVVACGSNEPKGSSPQPGTAGTGSDGGTGGGQVAVKKLGDAEFTVLAGTVTGSEASVSGEASLRFNLARLDDDSNYDLAFTLPESGASLTLVANANESLQNGVSLSFTRQADGKLDVTLKTPADNVDISDQFEAVSASGPLTLPVDIHQHGDVIVDLPGSELAGEGFQYRPSGRSWGLILNKAVVTKAVASNAKHEHD